MWLYSHIPLDRLYKYIYIYKHSILKFFDKIFIGDAMPEKTLKYALFQKF